MSPYYTIRVKQEHLTALGYPGDIEGEFVRDISAELLKSDGEGDPRVIGKIGALLIRGGEAANQRISILDSADAHSGSAERVTSSVFGRYHQRINEYAEQCVHEMIYLEEIKFSEDCTRSDLDLWFILRFCQQLDVHLIVVDADYKRVSRLGFRKMIGNSKDYLMRSSAFVWNTDDLAPLEAPYDATVQ